MAGLGPPGVKVDWKKKNLKQNLLLGDSNSCLHSPRVPNARNYATRPPELQMAAGLSFLAWFTWKTGELRNVCFFNLLTVKII